MGRARRSHQPQELESRTQVDGKLSLFLSFEKYNLPRTRPKSLAGPLTGKQTSLIVSGFAFIAPVSSSIAAPALDNIGTDLHIRPGVGLQMVMSIFLLTAALGPFVLSPCSEIWGRRPVIRIGNVIFALFTTLCGFAATGPQITAYRFLAGIGGSASIGVGPSALINIQPGLGLTPARNRWEAAC